MHRKKKLLGALLGDRAETGRTIANMAAFARFMDGSAADATVVPAAYANRRLVHEDVARRIIGEETITYLEFGVFEGESISWWRALNAQPGSRFVGFDTFTGLPEDWDGKARGHFDVAGSMPRIDDARVSFVAGLFQDTLRPFLKGFEPRGRIVLHMDADLYSSTLFCLSQLDHLLVPGSVVMFDEFSSVNHEFAAFEDYRRSFGRSGRVVARTEDFEHIAFVMA